MEGFTKIAREQEVVPENEIRVSNKQRKIQSYITYAKRLLANENVEKIVIKATGAAIIKAHILIEEVKRQVGDLHQQNEILTFEMVDTYEPEIEGLEVVVQKRNTQQIVCTLSREAIDTSHYGYQKPEPKQERSELPHKRFNRPREQKKDGDNKPKGGNASSQRQVTNKGGPINISDEEGKLNTKQYQAKGRGKRLNNYPVDGQKTKSKLNDYQGRDHDKKHEKPPPKRYNDYEVKTNNDRHFAPTKYYQTRPPRGGSNFHQPEDREDTNREEIYQGHRGDRGGNYQGHRGDRGGNYQGYRGDRGGIYQSHRGDRGGNYQGYRGDRGGIYQGHRGDRGGIYQGHRGDRGGQRMEGPQNYNETDRDQYRGGASRGGRGVTRYNDDDGVDNTQFRRRGQSGQYDGPSRGGDPNERFSTGYGEQNRAVDRPFRGRGRGQGGNEPRGGAVDRPFRGRGQGDYRGRGEFSGQGRGEFGGQGRGEFGGQGRGEYGGQGRGEFNNRGQADFQRGGRGDFGGRGEFVDRDRGNFRGKGNIGDRDKYDFNQQKPEFGHSDSRGRGYN